MFRIWSGPEGSSHKEPLSGIRIHRAHGLSFCAVLPNRAMLDAARHPERQFVIQKARHDQKVYALPFSCQLVRSGWRSPALPKHRWLRASRGDEVFGVSLVLGFACGIARLPSALPALAGSRQNRLKGHIYLIIESLALCRSLALPKHRLLRALGASGRCPYICNEMLTHLQGSPYYHESD